MNMEKIYKEVKEKLKDEIFSEGYFKVMVGEKTVIETESLILKTGSIIPKNWEALEDAIYGFDGVRNTKVIFENEQGQFPCLVYDRENPMVSMMPGVQLPEELENRMKEVISYVKREEDFKQMGFDLEVWNNYLAAKSDNKNKPKI